MIISISIVLLVWSCSSSNTMNASNKRAMQMSSDCNITFAGFDKNLRKERKELELEYLFGFTSPKLKSIYKQRDLVECQANLTRLDKDIYLRMHFEIAASNASATYGQIPKGNIMVIDLIDGKKIYSYAASNSKGKYDKATKNTVYDVLYLIEKTGELSSTEIDKIGIMWTSGFEDYPIFEVDFLMRQFKCLGNN